MKTLDLTKYGILGTTEIVHNPSYEDLFVAETDPTLTGFEKGQVTELGAVNVMTGIYTGRSPKDKFIVMDENSKDTVWWTSDEFKNDNHPCSEETWAAVAVSAIELSNTDKKIIDDGEESTKLADLFPNPRLSAEIEIIKNVDRNLYQCFKDKMLELNSIAKEIDEAAGPSLDFLLDEIKEQCDDSSVDAVKNMGVSIINVEDGKIANK